MMMTPRIAPGWIGCVGGRCNGGRTQEQRARDGSAQKVFDMIMTLYSI